MTSITLKDGKCGKNKIRIKTWKSGFSLKCLEDQCTIVGTPFIQKALDYNLKTFCWNCSKAEGEKKP